MSSLVNTIISVAFAVVILTVVFRATKMVENIQSFGKSAKKRLGKGVEKGLSGDRGQTEPAKDEKICGSVKTRAIYIGDRSTGTKNGWRIAVLDKRGNNVIRKVDIPELNGDDSYVIGRIDSDESDLKLKDDTVTYNHAIVGKKNGKLYLFDNDSTNGTWTDDGMVDEVEIVDGLRVKLGNSYLRFNKSEV